MKQERFERELRKLRVTQSCDGSFFFQGKRLKVEWKTSERPAQAENKLISFYEISPDDIREAIIVALKEMLSS